MKVLKRIGLVLLILVAIAAIIPLFVSPEFKVERSIVVKQPRWWVYLNLLEMENNKRWDPWYMEGNPDTVTIYTVAGEPGMGQVENFVMKMGADSMSGSMTTVELVEGELIGRDLVFNEWDMTMRADFLLSDTTGGTKVIWTNYGTVDYLGRYFLLFGDMEKSTGAEFEFGLAKMKPWLEALPIPKPKKPEMATDSLGTLVETVLPADSI